MLLLLIMLSSAQRPTDMLCIESPLSWLQPSRHYGSTSSRLNQVTDCFLSSVAWRSLAYLSRSDSHAPASTYTHWWSEAYAQTLFCSYTHAHTHSHPHTHLQRQRRIPWRRDMCDLLLFSHPGRIRGLHIKNWRICSCKLHHRCCLRALKS